MCTKCCVATQWVAVSSARVYHMLNGGLINRRASHTHVYQMLHCDSVNLRVVNTYVQRVTL